MFEYQSLLPEGMYPQKKGGNWKAKQKSTELGWFSENGEESTNQHEDKQTTHGSILKRTRY
jgi:hypothetical protein